MGSNQGIRCPDETGNVIWTNIYIPEDVTENSIGITAGNTGKFNTALYVLAAPQLADTHCHEPVF